MTQAGGIDPHSYLAAERKFGGIVAIGTSWWLTRRSEVIWREWPLPAEIKLTTNAGEACDDPARLHAITAEARSEPVRSTAADESPWQGTFARRCHVAIFQGLHSGPWRTELSVLSGGFEAIMWKPVPETRRITQKKERWQSV